MSKGVDMKLKRLALLPMIILLPQVVWALNFGEIKSLSRSIARDPIPASGTPRISEVVVSSYVNVAVQETAMFTWCLESSTSIPVVVGQREYDFTDDMVAIQRVSIDGTKIESTSIAKLDTNSNGTWQSSISTGNPSLYYTYNGVIGFDVIPSTKTNTTITVTYIKIPDALVADTDVPFDNVPRYMPFHFAVCFFTAALMCYTDNRPAEGDRYYQMYTDRIRNMTSTIRLSPDYYPVFTGGGK